MSTLTSADSAVGQSGDLILRAASGKQAILANTRHATCGHAQRKKAFGARAIG